MVLRRLVRLSAVFIGVFIIATFAFASATLAAGGGTSKSTSSLSIGNQVHLGTGPFGPGATVTISYTCFPGFGGKGGYGGGAFGSVQLGDLNGDQGFQSFSPICDDKKHTTTVFVSGFFTPGAGAASAFLCGFDCASKSQEVKIS